jgi:glycosyltransferase involved in cell wall biosynthesis
MRCPALNELPLPPLGKAGWPWLEGSAQLSDTLPDGRPWPKVSIVTPSYNQGQFLEETIRSVLLQGYPDLDYVIIDGGSTDGSVDMIRKYERWVACWVSEKDGGQSEAINTGWLKSTGALLAYLNSDDTYCPGTVAAAVSYLVQHPDIGMVYADSNFIDATGSLLKLHKGKQMDFEEVLCWSCHISQPTVFLRREVIDQVGMMNTDFHYAMDYDLWSRVASQHRIRHLPQVLANERHYAASKTVAAPELGLKGRIYAVEHFSSPGHQPEIHALKSKALATHCYKLSRYYLGMGNPAAARANALRALKVRPPVWLAGINVLLFALGLIPSPRFGMWLRKVALRFVKSSNTYPYMAS